MCMQTIVIAFIDSRKGYTVDGCARGAVPLLNTGGGIRLGLLR